MKIFAIIQEVLFWLILIGLGIFSIAAAKELNIDIVPPILMTIGLASTHISSKLS